MTRFAFLSTYPPTRCGLATFTHALSQQLGDRQHTTGIVRVLDAPTADSPSPFAGQTIVAELIRGLPETRAASIRALNGFDIAIVQHEYGIYGGTDGDEVIPVLEGLKVPTIVVLHTVLETPTPGQKAVLERVAALATKVVVMSDRALDLLAERYDVRMDKVALIPHGVSQAVIPADRVAGRRILTWGLVGPGKGIEWGIRAMAELGDMDPRPQYVVLGRTHPKVLEHEGERYRDGLTALVKQLDLGDVVSFVDEYLDPSALARHIAAADVVLLPYDSRDQVTSGVLVEAIAAGKPVISTAFPHAIELLGDGAGVIVKHQDPSAIAAAVRTVFADVGSASSGAAQRMAQAAARVSIGTSWAEVARAYRALADDILAVRAA